MSQAVAAKPSEENTLYHLANGVVVTSPEACIGAGGSLRELLAGTSITTVALYYQLFVESSVAMTNSSLVPREGEDDNTANGLKAKWLAFTGLAGEAIEVKEVTMGDDNARTYIETLIGELGDVAWYFFLMVSAFKLSAYEYTQIESNGQLIKFGDPDWMIEFQRTAYAVNWDFSRGIFLEDWIADRMVVAAGKLLEISKKALIHGKMGNLSAEFVAENVLPQMRIVFQCLALLANHYSHSIFDVLVLNMEKLVKRRAEKSGAFAPPTTA